jgi:hypothetical protein
MILVDEEIGKRCMRIRKGINTGGAGDLTEDIFKEGPGGNYLLHRSTMKNFRNNDEIYHNMTFPLDRRAQTDERSVDREVALGIVKNILSGPHEDALPEEIMIIIDNILKEADEGISEQ